ncbi:unnamed protein product [Mycena citricolor]|uniref:Uncharacterized protein n=1 Tax=Mycena citricolor TaxID=2018698 RepID=A0AAD2H9X9_9AGAR|nr:unnamed protein product [Mycena citricolor]
MVHCAEHERTADPGLSSRLAAHEHVGKGYRRSRHRLRGLVGRHIHRLRGVLRVSGPAWRDEDAAKLGVVTVPDSFRPGDSGGEYHGIEERKQVQAVSGGSRGRQKSDSEEEAEDGAHVRPM